MAMAYAVVLAPMAVTQQTAARQSEHPPAHQSQRTPVQARALPEPTDLASAPLGYDDTVHAATVEQLWGITEPALVELLDEDGDGSGQINLWTAGRTPAIPTETQFEPSVYDDGTLAVSLPLGSETLPIVTETAPVYFVTLTNDTVLVAGTLTGPTGDAFIVATLATTTVDYHNHPIEPVTQRSLHIVEVHETLDDAAGTVRDASEAQPFPKDEGVFYYCHTPWTGTDGFPCCALDAIHSANNRACYYRWLGDLSGCLIEAGGAVFACIVTCIKFLTPTPLTIKACLIGCAIGGIAYVVLCIHGVSMQRGACEAEAWAAYLESLVEKGCYPPPLP